MGQGFGSYESAQKFFEANQNLMPSCSTVQCLDFNKAQPIKHIFEKFLSTQTDGQNKLELIPDPQHVLLMGKNVNTGSSFSLECGSLFLPGKRRALGYCDGYLQGKQVYALEEESNSFWKESLFLSEPKSEHIFSKQDNPKLFEKIIEQSNQPIDPLTKGSAPINSEIVNPLNMTLFAVGAIGICYCIYKIHSIITKRWKNESQKEEPPVISSTTNIEQGLQQIENLKIREVLFSFPLEVRKSSPMKELVSFIQELQKEGSQEQLTVKTEQPSHIKFQGIFLSFSDKVQDSSLMNELVILLETNFPTFAQNRKQILPQISS